MTPPDYKEKARTMVRGFCAVPAECSDNNECVTREIIATALAQVGASEYARGVAAVDHQKAMAEAWEKDANTYKKWLLEAIEDIETGCASEDGMDGSVADKWRELKEAMADPPPDRALTAEPAKEKP